ncbi:MAG: sugar ABC transporter ATP-binding protein [Pseudomonadota bacterium]
MQHSLLTLTDIRKSFGGVRALERASLELPSGAVTALIGENGAGKSTLVKILSGIYQPDGGEILFDGKAVRIANPLAARALGIGVVHQECLVFDNLSVAENLFVNSQPVRGRLVDWRAMNAKATAVLRDLDADFDAGLPAGHLSIAQKHVVQIARALTHESRVLIFDEPTASLSQHECTELFRIVRKLRDAGCALLFISHKFDEIFALADRYAVFRDGVSVSDGRVSDVTCDELISLMVGRPINQLFPKLETTPGDELLRVESLCSAGEFENISFTLRSGEIVGLYGLVGAGRTELAQVLFGLRSASAGTIKLAGATGLALVPEDRQSQGAVLPFSVAANIALPNLRSLAPRGWTSTAREARLARQWIDKLGIKARGPEQPVHDLSGGNQQKVVIAKWLARNPGVLILDEPTKGIDVGAKAAVHAVTGEFARAGGAVLMISSDLPEILGMSDRVLVMRRGRLRGEFARLQANSENLLRAASEA